MVGKNTVAVAEAYDYGAYEDEIPVGDNLMARLSALATKQMRTEARMLELEAAYKQAKEELRHISENLMPKLMEEADMENFTTGSGLAIAIKQAIRGSIPKANETEAFAYLEDNGDGKLIKREFKIDFGKGDEKWADKFERDLAQRKRPLNVKRKKAVNPQTLQAWVRTKLAEGVPIPMDVFGVFQQRFSKVTVK